MMFEPETLELETLEQDAEALAQALFFRPRLAALLQAAARDGLPLIVLKGAALAETLYSSPNLRPYGDIDVLIRPTDRARARTLLESLGYVVSAFVWEAFQTGEDTQANFFQPVGRGVVVVELHTDLINNAFFRGHIGPDTHGLWARSHPARLAGADACVLGPEDQALHLCLHLAGHYLSAPRSLRDLDLACRQDAFDWPQFACLAQEARASLLAYASLYAAQTLHGTPVPPDISAALAPRHGAARLARLAAHSATGAAPDRLRVRLLWALLGTTGARVSALRCLLFPRRGWLVSHYYYDLFDASADAPAGQLGIALRLRLWGAHGKALARRLLG